MGQASVLVGQGKADRGADEPHAAGDMRDRASRRARGSLLGYQGRRGLHPARALPRRSSRPRLGGHRIPPRDRPWWNALAGPGDPLAGRACPVPQRGKHRHPRDGQLRPAVTDRGATGDPHPRPARAPHDLRNPSRARLHPQGVARRTDSLPRTVAPAEGRRYPQVDRRIGARRRSESGLCRA